MPATAPSLLIFLLMFAGSLLFFGKVYRTALAWFVRGRQNQRWEALAELATITASAPFAFVFGLVSIELNIFFVRFGLASSLPFNFLQVYLDFLTANKILLVFTVSLFHLLRTVPQTIASSKVYTFDLNNKLRNELPGQGN